MKNVYLGRVPILDNNSNLCAYEILYRDAQKKIQANDRHTSASVISSVLNKFGTHSILGDRQGFVRVDEKFLMSDIIFSIPNQFFVFALLKNVSMSEKVIERIQQLDKKGYTLAINNMALDGDILKKYEPILQNLSFIKANINLEFFPSVKEIIQEIQLHDIKVIATLVDDQEVYNFAKELGFDWFQGYFFAQPKILKNAKYEATHMNVLKLYNLLMQDVNIDEITQEFENNPEITVQLLQFINSGYFHFRQRISSIHHVLTLVGRMAIGQWLMLMIYSKSVSNGSERSPLMLMVKNRTELMENILKIVQPNVKSNMLGEAYMVGVLSLIGVIFSMNLRDILDSIHISDEVRNALLENEGILGEIYALIQETERFDIRAIYRFEKKYGLENKTIENLVLQSMQEVQIFENPIVE